ncbi:hypothetical protein SESBI_36963 [Sesbania bispinosa]|nr:hypothetical protein SESBI_36963 [Sesbania bispinosa]
MTGLVVATSCFNLAIAVISVANCVAIVRRIYRKKKIHESLCKKGIDVTATIEAVAAKSTSMR